MTEVLKACQEVDLVKNGSPVNWESIRQKAQERLAQCEANESRIAQRKDDQEAFLGRSRRRQKLENDDEDRSSASESEDEEEEEGDAIVSDLKDLDLHPSLITIGTVGHP